MALTAKQQRFVEEYLIDLNATQAAIRAGYSINTAAAIGYENLGEADVSAAIQQAIAERSKRTQITADRVLKEYANIAFSNMTDFLKVEERTGRDEVGNPIYYKTVTILNTESIDKDKVRAISEIKQTRDGITIKLHDKIGALDSIARHLGMFKE
ncbi:terminase small subunit [Paenibacillus glycanilyticus]|uniref:Terminase n=1 Tax=Paenibacillus glycanilyticus TaxID=126569 RepID=A0ABQ6GFD9_9BACL|nr:terminase small subunit [Paenibacillus glycanilyticus]GLX68316.1 terminase [Paenibacillus glycanilyticus]